MFTAMKRLDKATTTGIVLGLFVLTSCISAEDPKTPPTSHSAPTGGAASGEGGAAPGQGGAAPEVGGAAPGEGGAAPGQGGATPDVGGATPGVGGNGTGGVAPTTGGHQGVGGGVVTGGERGMGGFPSFTGGANSVGGGVSTGGRVSTGSCDFTSAACTSTCASFASSPASSWKQAPCEALIKCLDTNASCITATDPLCGPKQAPTYAAPVCGNDYFNAASDTDIAAAVTTYVKCVCGF